MKKVLIVFGGVSSEHDVSLISARSVIENIPRDKFDVLTLGITKDGRWYLYTGDSDKLPESKWLEDESKLTTAVVSPDRSVHGITVLSDSGAENIYIDAVFPVLHGKNGEDGTIQGLFTLAGIPFVGCDTLSSAMTMDKAITNTIADYAGIAQAKWLGSTAFDYNKAPESFEEQCASYLGFPCFVKPANAGSSVGVTKANNAEELTKAIALAFEHDGKIVVEEGIDGSEVECAVIGNEDTYAPVVGEIVPCNDFYDFDAKYVANSSELHIPARFSEEKRNEVSIAARKVFSALGCSGLSRVDFFVRKSDNAVLFNEINTIPGFTSISMYAKLLMADGMTFSEITEKLIDLAIEKWSD